MTAATKKRLTARGSPRYRFTEDDKRVIRFRSNRLGRIVQTRLFDFSVSGIAFLVAEKLAPRVGELIKLDFAPMGSLRIACTARVVRIEAPGKNAAWSKFPDTVKIGIAYEDLPEAYRKMLVECLDETLKPHEGSPEFRAGGHLKIQKPYSEVAQISDWFIENGWSFLIAVSLVVFAGVGIYLLSQSSGVSKTSTNAAWASGFFEKVIPPKSGR